jgi:hypothetical protein
MKRHDAGESLTAYPIVDCVALGKMLRPPSKDASPGFLAGLKKDVEDALREVWMIVIRRNGRVTVISGWRAWVVGAIMAVATALVFGVVAFLILGLAVSVTAFVMILIPPIVIVALLVHFSDWFGERRD